MNKMRDRVLRLLGMAACLGMLAAVAAAQQGTKPKLVREPIQEDQPEPEPDSASVTEYNPLKAEKSLNVGKYYMGQDKIDAAVGRFRAALAFKPDYPEACRWLAKALEKQKKYKEAAAALLDFENKFPKSPAVADLRKERLRLEKKS